MAKNSIIMICKNIKLDKDYQNVLTYTEQQLYNLCYENKVDIANNFSFIQDVNNSILVPFTYENCLKCNYMAYQNPRYSNKWFFAFINSVDYVSDKTTRINFSVDVFSTWFEYWTATNCFVEREHTNNDAVGSNTLPESLEIGEYIIQSGKADVAGTLDDDTEDLHYIGIGDRYIVVAMTDWIPDLSIPQGVRVYNGIYSGLKYYLFRSEADADNFITDMQNEFSSDPIASIFIVPRKLAYVSENAWSTPQGKNYEFAYYPYSDNAIKFGDGVYIAKPDHLDTNYIPVNRKLLTFPYCFLLISNNAGTVKEYRYEFFNGNTYCTFDLYGAVIPGCSIKLYPTGYNIKNPAVVSTAMNNYEAIDAPKLPTCSWTNDTYTNWLTQNSVNNPLNMIKNVGSIVAGGAITLATGGTGAVLGGGMMIAGATGVFEQMKQKYEHSLAPETAKGGSNQGNLTYALYDTFTANRVSIRREYAEIIDDYFTRFGYQTNKIKLPNQIGRTYFNFVKIGAAEIIGYPNDKGLPADAMDQINNIYRKGVTLWHSHDRIGNYTGNNIVQ